MNVDLLANMDFCQLVVDELQAAVFKWNSEGSKQSCAEGCAIVPLIMYLDCLNMRNVSVMHTRTPRATILSDQQLKKIHNADIIVKGKIHLDSYKFGKLPVCSHFSVYLCFLTIPFFCFSRKLKCEPILTFLHVDCFFCYSGRR